MWWVVVQLVPRLNSVGYYTCVSDATVVVHVHVHGPRWDSVRARVSRMHGVCKAHDLLEGLWVLPGVVHVCTNLFFMRTNKRTLKFMALVRM